MKNYAVGCAFNMNEMFMNFPYKKLKLTCEDCRKITGNPHRSFLVKLMFRECFKIVIHDIIHNNITFWLPTGAKKCNIHMKATRGEDFKNLRRFGKWKDVDILESNFTGYELALYMYGKTKPRIKPIYLNKELKNKIIENTNKGMQYGDGKTDKTIHDYYDIILYKYPDVPLSEIKRILNYAWKSLYLHNSYGGDTFIVDYYIWCYIGYLKYDSIEYFHYYIKKLIIKLRVLYKRKRIQWDGYYYFALSLTEYDRFIGEKSKRGRPKKNFTFENIMMYLILDECKIKEFNKQYIFKIPYIDYIKTKFLVKKIKTDKAELIILREPLKFKDILVQYNNYDVL